MTKHIEKNYQNYLKLSELEETKMHPDQIVETKRAFYAGFGSMIVELQKFAKISEKESHKMMDEVIEEVNGFYFSESVIHGLKNSKN